MNMHSAPVSQREVFEVFNTRYKGLESKSPRITCVCGAEILVVPDVKLMSDAIENHLKTCGGKKSSAINRETELDRIRDYLIAQVLKIASENEELF
jgi:hypothetical protein